MGAKLTPPGSNLPLVGLPLPTHFLSLYPFVNKVFDRSQRLETFQPSIPSERPAFVEKTKTLYLTH